MCTMIVKKVELDGSGQGTGGWFSVNQANVSYDHPFHIQHEHALNIDFVNEDLGLDARVAVELSEAGCSAVGCGHPGCPATSEGGRTPGVAGSFVQSHTALVARWGFPARCRG